MRRTSAPDYLYRRPGSQMWWLRLQYPASSGRKKVQQSLGTPNRAEAEILALPKIQEHKQFMWMERNRVEGRAVWRHTGRWLFPLGKSTLEDGTRIVADEKSAVLIHPDGRIEDAENCPEIDSSYDFDPENPPENPLLLTYCDENPPPPRPAWPASKKASPPKEPVDDSDYELLESFLALKKRNPYYESEARETWAEFKTLVGHKPLSACTRRDGEALVAFYRAKPLKDATIIKKVNFLKAPLAHRLERHDPRQDIFHKVITEVQDQTERLCFDEEEMKYLHHTMLPKLGEDERRMWLILAATGMRHSEVFAIEEEFSQGGIRYVKVGRKTDSSKRLVPLPDCLIPHLPWKITGPLFEDPSLKNISKNLLRALRRAKIVDERKVIYSLRHRAHTRLREVECPEDIQREIVGHENGDSHTGYGKFPLHRLKQWIDQIGMPPVPESA